MYKTSFGEAPGQLQSGAGPDLLLAYTSDIASLAKRGAVIPLDELMGDARTGFTADDLKDIAPAFIDRYPAFGYRVYSLGMARSMQVMFYNADLLKAAGFDKPPQSWDDFAKICAAVTKSPDVYCYEMQPEASTFVTWVWSRGGDHLSANGQAILFDRKPGLDALVLLNDLFRNKQAITAGRALQEPSDLAAGKVAFTFDAITGLPYYDRAIKSAAKPANWGIAPLPHSTADPVVALYGPGLAIARSTPERQQAAFVLIKWLMEREQGAEWARALWYLPARQSARTVLADFSKANPLYAGALDWAPLARGEPAVAAWSPIRALIGDTMAQVAAGKTAPEVALQDLAKKANAALAAQ